MPYRVELLGDVAGLLLIEVRYDNADLAFWTDQSGGPKVEWLTRGWMLLWH